MRTTKDQTIFISLIVVIVSLAISLVIFFFCSRLPAKDEVNEMPPSDVVQVAVEGLRPLLESVPDEDIVNYGFSSKEELSQATVGEPFRIYTITPDKIMHYTEEIELTSLISPTSLWIFPVLCRSEVRTLLTVDFVNGEPKAVAIGSSGLARQLALVKSKWPRSDGYDYKFIRIYQANADFVLLLKNGVVKITPLDSAALILKLKKTAQGVYELYNPSEIIPKLIPIVRQALY